MVKGQDVTIFWVPHYGDTISFHPHSKVWGKWHHLSSADRTEDER